MKMEITIRLNDGKELTVTDENYSALVVEEKMNNTQVQGIALANNVFNKHQIAYVVPTGTVFTNE
jgi:hypothetical protein